MSQTVPDHFSSLFPPEEFSGVTSILVAVSGGVDSVVLLHLLQSVAPDYGLDLEVAHLDHGIRSESAADADFVAELCRDWGLSCHVDRAEVPALATRRGWSLEMAGRQARREFLQRTADERGYERIALAHHRDDQVETFFLRLLRGTGISGLSSMHRLQGCWWRPLLAVSRQQILAYAKQQGLRWVEDESNRDPVFLRNRLRQQIVPQLREFNPQLDERLSVLCAQVQLEEDFWQQQLDQLFPRLVVSGQNGFRLDRILLLGLHPAMRLRVLREALRQVRGDLQRIEADHLQAIENLLQADRSQAQLDLPDCWVARRYGQLWLRTAPPARPQAYDLPLPFSGEVELPDGRTLGATVLAEQQGESLAVAEFSLAEFNEPLRIRSWQAGDRFEPAGMLGCKRLKRFFSDDKMEIEERARVPLLVSGEIILWVVGRRRSRHAIANLQSGPVLRLELI